MTDREDFKEPIQAAIESLNYNISFLQELKANIEKGDGLFLIKNILGANCIHRYIQDKLMDEVYAIRKKVEKGEHQCK